MQDCKEFDILSVTTTVPSLTDGQRLARLLVESRLAACVQLDQCLVSVYRWQGQLCEQAEVRLSIKTLPECLAALQAWLVEHHPYEVPQFLAARQQASPVYAQWLRAQVRAPAAD
ncbi:divalent-cation tolerance protein CutA [uncultured Ramlibacter sp.]|mgnify:CR=1 FL=1|uniref:divalent-cation tolerance protein CutA n=1 Tax=uncultured Ramlibacter sp. TaxID=260755 RepID=UPI0026198816|nr:divalent-cation tolerance protein CutA [uncultured Ramlibacter sp.]